MDTLVLDIGMQPVNRIPWTQAIIKVLIDKKARVIEEYSDRYINTVSWRVNMPSVIMLLKPMRRRKAIKFSRHVIYLRDKSKCQYCGIKVSKSEMTYEHVIPRSQGGRTCFENIVLACGPCNQKKAGRTPEQAGMKLLSQPVKPTSLPADTFMAYNESMPREWRSYLYWNMPLEEG